MTVGNPERKNRTLELWRPDTLVVGPEHPHVGRRHRRNLVQPHPTEGSPGTQAGGYPHSPRLTSHMLINISVKLSEHGPPIAHNPFLKDVTPSWSACSLVKEQHVSDQGNRLPKLRGLL